MLEAFQGRGGDRRTNKDVEDIVFMLDGRLGLEEEVNGAPAEVRDYSRNELNALLKVESLVEASAGLPYPRITDECSLLLLDKLRRMAAG